MHGSVLIYILQYVLTIFLDSLRDSCILTVTLPLGFLFVLKVGRFHVFVAVCAMEVIWKITRLPSLQYVAILRCHGADNQFIAVRYY